MAMVIHSTHGMYKDFIFLTDGGDIWPKPVLHLLSNGLATIFCAEDQMNGILRVAMGHSLSREAFYLWPRRWRSILFFRLPTANAVGYFCSRLWRLGSAMPNVLLWR